MKNIFEDQAVRDSLQKQIDELMQGVSYIIRGDDTMSKLAFYNFTTHSYLQENCSELLFPIEQQEWPMPFQDMASRHDQTAQWPQFTTYFYCMDVMTPPNIPAALLHFGYVLYEDRLVRCTFFVVRGMVPGQSSPQGFVVDPLAAARGITPSCYIGIPVFGMEHIEKLAVRENPLESYVKTVRTKQDKEERRKTYMDAYDYQMTFAPEYFHPKLKEFAEQEELYVPPIQKSTRTSYED